MFETKHTFSGVDDELFGSGLTKSSLQNRDDTVPFTLGTMDSWSVSISGPIKKLKYLRRSQC
jgi:hypothetical protein